MAAADWTSISDGSGVFAIASDATAPSPTAVMFISAGGQMFQNITGGPFMNSRMSGWVRQEQSTTQIAFLLALRSQNTTFIAAPASMFLARIFSLSATQVRIRIDAIVAGVVTTIITADLASVNGNPINSWQQYRFSSFNSAPDILLRVEQWNGAAFIPMVDAAAPIASFAALNAAGSGRFGHLLAVGVTVNYIDDVAFYSLT